MELFHILQHFDDAFSARQRVQKFRLKLLKELLFECVQDFEIIRISLTNYESARPWLSENKENIWPSDFNIEG